MSFVTTAPRAHGFHDAAPATADSSLVDGPKQQHHLQHQHQHQHHFVATGMTDSSKAGFYNPQMPPQISCEIKPRLTKEQHDILEAHFQKQNKPNTQTKKGFAESLNVSLDKVNNWFQNRRAKSKQDAKKQAGTANPLTQPQQSATSPAQQSTTSSNAAATTGATGSSETSSDASPVFSSSDYFGMMQSCSSDEQLSVAMPHPQQFQEQSSSSSSENGWPYNDASLDHLSVPAQVGHDMFDSAQDLNRRTLTQEQFDAFAHNAGLMRGSDGFSGGGGEDNDDILHHFFPDMDLKQSDDMAMLHQIAAPLSSHDSSIPSSISEQSMFPASGNMQDFSSISTTSSDWTDSRSSSVSGTHPHDAAFPQPTSTSGAQWQPGQSIPIDPTAHIRQFRDAAQARQVHPQPSRSEQPLAWPSDDTYARRESQSSAILAQQMSNFGLQTPAPQQDGGFTAPPPPASIAARRQRPRPAALGLAALRSQSYSGAGQAASPGQNGAAGTTTNQQQLRRIRSVNVLNGMAPGRVMKSTPGSAQRSPLNWTFADAMVSPKALRHSSSASMGSLAPPTPMSPRETSTIPEGSRSQFPPWQSSFSRHASISETDDEHNVPPPSASGLPQNFSSPPQTPMYPHAPQQQYVPAPVNPSDVVTENTPPQSAPAVQQTFPASAYVLPPQAQQSQQAGAFMAAQAHAYMNASHADPRFQVPFAPPAVSHMSGATTEMPMQFAHGMPMIGAQGDIAMAFTPPVHFIPHPPPAGALAQHKPVAGPAPFNFMPSSNPLPSFQKPAQPAAELFVHEYSPPSSVKRAATPRKAPADSGPKNYTFANQGPEHFEKDRARKAASDGKPAAAASDSPSSSVTSS